jgi:DNA-binding transcriptional MerR regulator
MSERRPLRIGELAERTGTTPRTIRYYEEIGLLPASEEREQGKRRLYAEADVERLQELIRLRDVLNLSLDELGQLVAAEAARAELRREFQETDDPDQRRRLLDQAAEHISNQLKLVRGRKQELQRLERELVSRQRRVRSRRSALGSPPRWERSTPRPAR